MSRYYLMAQLPSLDGLADSAPLPITEERFNTLCSELLDKKELEAFEGLTLVPDISGEGDASEFADIWNRGERELRLALGIVRGRRLGKDFDPGDTMPSADLMQLAQTAAYMDNPMEAELYLNKYRLDFLETLRPMDAFSREAVLYYGLKLKLLTRIRQFDRVKGEASYRRIYDSIINGDELEDIK